MKKISLLTDPVLNFDEPVSTYKHPYDLSSASLGTLRSNRNTHSGQLLGAVVAATLPFSVTVPSFFTTLAYLQDVF